MEAQRGGIACPNSQPVKWLSQTGTQDCGASKSMAFFTTHPSGKPAQFLANFGGWGKKNGDHFSSGMIFCQLEWLGKETGTISETPRFPPSVANLREDIPELQWKAEPGSLCPNGGVTEAWGRFPQGAGQLT